MEKISLSPEREGKIYLKYMDLMRLRFTETMHEFFQSKKIKGMKVSGLDDDFLPIGINDIITDNDKKILEAVLIKTTEELPFKKEIQGGRIYFTTEKGVTICIREEENSEIERIELNDSNYVWIKTGEYHSIEFEKEEDEERLIYAVEMEG